MPDSGFTPSMSPHQYCRDRAAQSGSSFYYSFLFLPEERRRAIIALYAFCREVDDVVDEIDDPAVYTRPWTASIPLERDDAYQIYEYACHEGNHAVEHILRGGRIADKTPSR